MSDKVEARRVRGLPRFSLILLLSLTCTFAGWAKSPEEEGTGPLLGCNPALLERAEPPPPGPTRPEDLAASVRVSERPATATEGAHIVFERDAGRAWYSNFGKAKYAPQGDPFWFEKTWGARTALAFGWQQRSLTELWGPTPEFFNTRLSVLMPVIMRKKGLKNGLWPHFYRTSEQLGDLAYVRRFIQDMGLPVAMQGWIAVHDYSFHLAAALLPPTVWSNARRHVAMVVRWIDFLGRNEKRLPQGLVPLLQVNLYNRMADLLDRGSGNFVSNWATITENAPASQSRIESKAAYYGFEYLAVGGRDPLWSVNFHTQGILETLFGNEMKNTARYPEVLEIDRLLQEFFESQRNDWRTVLAQSSYTPEKMLEDRTVFIASLRQWIREVEIVVGELF